LGTLEPGEEATVTIQVRPTTVGEVPNEVCAEATDVGEECDDTTTTVLPNIVIDKLDDRDPVRVGSNILYTLRVTNEGSVTINEGDLVVIDELPIGDVRLVSVDSNFFDCDPLDPPTGRILCVSTADFERDDIASIKITVDPDEAGTIENTAKVRANRVFISEDTEETIVEGTTTGTTGTTSDTTGTTSDTTGTTSDTTGTTSDTTGTTSDTTGTTSGTTTGGTDGEASPTADTADDVIVDTIPETDKLPETGGSSLLALGAGVALVAGAASLIRSRR
jgi:LPXTG-motif cell wall-anchored protein